MRKKGEAMGARIRLVHKQSVDADLAAHLCITMFYANEMGWSWDADGCFWPIPASLRSIKTVDHCSGGSFRGKSLRLFLCRPDQSPSKKYFRTRPTRMPSRP